MTNPNLDHRLGSLRAEGRFPDAVLDAFARWIDEGKDEQLYRVNPMAFAAEHQLTPRDAVDLFIHAAHVGIFDFAWGLICPGCHAFISARAGLRGITGKHTCSMCMIPAGEALDDGVEVSFTISPAIRKIRFHGGWSALHATPREQLLRDAMQMYFAHSHPPAAETTLFSRGLLGLTVLKRGETGVVSLQLDPSLPGTVRLIAPAVHAVLRIQLDPEAPATAEVEVRDGQTFPEEVRLRPGAVQLSIGQRSEEPELLLGVIALDFEGIHGDPTPRVDFLTGKRLLSTQSFRELFRTETIDPDASLEIRALAMLFSDLKASTQLYERVGDLKALALVREHFALLNDVVARNDGAVVKTIGDAVMATFVEPRQAAQAAVEMHRAMTRVRPEELQLKVGLHLGPCVAIDSNARLDFFGQTVNIAARVQNLAEGREVVLTDAVFNSPGVREILVGAGLPVLREEASLKGIAGKVVVHRGTVA
jgi:class 3 adenylate cyclase